MSNAWRSRPAAPDDDEAIVGLLKEVYANYTIDHWRWQYLDNPPKKTCIFVAEDDTQIVGHLAMLPIYMNLRGEKILGAQSVDAAIDPMYRRQGIFASLSEECYAKAASQGIQLLYAFPNEAAYLGQMKLGWFDLGGLPRLVEILNPKAIIKRRVHSAMIATLAAKPVHLLLRAWKCNKRPEPVHQLKIVNVDSFDERFDYLWLKIKEKFSVSVWKDSSYLNWRYRSCPDKKYTVLAAEEQNDLIGFIVLSGETEQGDVGRVIDFLILPEKTVAAALLISAGLDCFKEQGKSMVICHMFEDSQFYRLFVRQGFFKWGRNRLIARVLTPALQSSMVLDFKQWHLVEGDIDVF